MPRESYSSQEMGDGATEALIKPIRHLTDIINSQGDFESFKRSPSNGTKECDCESFFNTNNCHKFHAQKTTPTKQLTLITPMSRVKQMQNIQQISPSWDPKPNFDQHADCQYNQPLSQEKCQCRKNCCQQFPTETIPNLHQQQTFQLNNQDNRSARQIEDKPPQLYECEQAQHKHECEYNLQPTQLQLKDYKQQAHHSLAICKVPEHNSPQLHKQPENECEMIKQRQKYQNSCQKVYQQNEFQQQKNQTTQKLNNQLLYEVHELPRQGEVSFHIAHCGNCSNVMKKINFVGLQENPIDLIQKSHMFDHNDNVPDKLLIERFPTAGSKILIKQKDTSRSCTAVNVDTFTKDNQPMEQRTIDKVSICSIFRPEQSIHSNDSKTSSRSNHTKKAEELMKLERSKCEAFSSINDGIERNSIHERLSPHTVKQPKEEQCPPKSKSFQTMEDLLRRFRSNNLENIIKEANYIKKLDESPHKFY